MEQRTLAGLLAVVRRVLRVGYYFARRLTRPIRRRVFAGALSGLSLGVTASDRMGYDDDAIRCLDALANSLDLELTAGREDPEFLHDMLRLRGAAPLAAALHAVQRSEESRSRLGAVLRGAAAGVMWRPEVGWDVTTAALRLMSLLSAAETLRRAGLALPEWNTWLRRFVVRHRPVLLWGRLCEPAGNHRLINTVGHAAYHFLLHDTRLPHSLIRRLSSEIKRQFLADGGHTERCPHYHLQALVLINSIAAADRERGGSCIGPNHEVVERATAALRIMTTPDGQLLRFGDAGRTFSGKQVSVELGELMGPLPASAAGVLPNFGIGCRKWIANERQMALYVDFGPHGHRDNPGHAHADALSYCVFCDGVAIITDPGTFVYASTSESIWFKLPEAHNTVHWPGNPAYRISGFFHWRRFPSAPLVTELGDGEASWSALHRWRSAGLRYEHVRAWCASSTGLSIRDVLSSESGEPARLTIGFGPGALPELLPDGTVALQAFRVGVAVEADAGVLPCEIRATPYAHGYGRLTSVSTGVWHVASTPAGTVVATTLRVE